MKDKDKKREWDRAYRGRPDIKRRRYLYLQRPEVKARMHKLSARPEAIAKRRAYEASPKRRAMVRRHRRLRKELEAKRVSLLEKLTHLV